MKKILALILVILICFVASCGVYEDEVLSSSDWESSCTSSMTEQSWSEESSTTSEEITSNEEPLIGGYEEIAIGKRTLTTLKKEWEKSVISGVTPEWFNAYEAYTDGHHSIGGERVDTDEIITQVVLSFEELESYVYASDLAELQITESLFEDNFVVLTRGHLGYDRSEDVYYSDFIRLGENRYSLTYNMVYWWDMFSDWDRGYADMCVIPKSLCEDDLSSIQIEVTEKRYRFEYGKEYNSDCEVYVWKPEKSEELVLNPSNPKMEVLSNVTKESLGAYTSYTDEYYHEIEDGVITWHEATTDQMMTKVVTSYEELLRCPIYDEAKEVITEEIFEDNFVVLVKGISSHIRTEDVFYNDFKKVINFYELTYNVVSWGQDFSEAIDPFSDICVIPKSLCKDDLSTLKVKIVKKEYKFDSLAEMYNGDCEALTYSAN